jgi:hypothetical protein
MTWSISRATEGYAVWYGGRSRVQAGGSLERDRRENDQMVSRVTLREKLMLRFQ